MRRLIPLLFLLSCSPFEPQHATRYTPLPVYQNWYQAMERCAGMCRTHWGAQEWWTVEGYKFPCPAYNGSCSGWWTPRHTITVASELKEDSLVVSHELLHDILQSGHNQFTDPIFKRCGV